MQSKPALRTLLAIAALGAGAHALAADPPASDTLITPLLEQPLTAREAPVASMLTVEYKPGASTPPHTHPADTFVYVLSGAIEMQVAGGEMKVLKAGDTYYEKPTDTHTVSRNASQTEPAKFLVVFVRDAGAPVLEPVAGH
ncbi:MAG: cupin domain-containing protein [Gammaproteobacteria bacterium]|nr:cupin domain-containing protein [Gammaproteobacteria bacterium]